MPTYQPAQLDLAAPYNKKNLRPLADGDYEPPTLGYGLASHSYGMAAGTNLANEANAVTQYGQSAATEYGGAGSAVYARNAKLGKSAYDVNAGYAGGARNQGLNAASVGNADLAYMQQIASGLSSQGLAANGLAGAYGQRATSDYGSSVQARATQMAALDRLNALAGQPQGASAAQAQLAQSTDASMAQTMAMARSGRGTSDAAAVRAAQFQNAATMQQAGAQAAVLRAQEDQAFRAQQLTAQQAVQQGYGAVRAQDASLMGQNASAQQAGGQLGLGYQSAGLQAQQTGLQAQSAGAQLGLGYGQLAQGYNATSENARSGYQQLGSGQQLAYEGMAANAQQYGIGLRNQMLANQMQTNAGLQNTGMQIAAQQNLANQAASAQQTGAIVGGIGTVVGGILSGGSSSIIGGGASAASGMLSGNEARASDERVKKDIQPAGESIDDTFRALKAQSYRYRDPTQPGAAPGTQYGPMAQDLARSPAGRSTVLGTPRGLAVDTSRLALLNASETARQRTQLDQIMRRLDALGGP